MLFDYTFAEYELPFTGFTLTVRAATNTDHIIATEFNRQGFRSPYGAVLWPASIALGHALCKRPALVRDKRVLEIGAGLAVPSLVAQKLGAASVVASDIHPDMAEMFAYNTARNGLQIPYVHYDWSDAAHRDRYDVILGSELLYTPEFTPLVIAVIKRLLVPGGVAVISDPQREHVDTLRQGFKSSGITWDEETQAASYADKRAHCIIFTARCEARP